MANGWEVRQYDAEKLAELLCSAAAGEARPRLHDVRRKLHITYLHEYLPRRDVQTIVVEKEYVDRDFLEDYAAYYVRCFRQYPRFCSRIHFFSEKFDEAKFAAVLRGEETEDFLTDSYCGFLVIKPLPETIIGRTCLSVYDDEERRHYPVARTCKAQLFGIDLQVESLPFQEQDTAVARCATSALWSVFHATARVFEHSVPSPVEITRSATIAGTGRALPNHGLTLTEVAAAIKACGLEPHSVTAENLDTLRMTAYAYLRAGICPYFSFLLVDPGTNPPEEFGRHAVAITGYSLPEDGEPVRSADGLAVRALRIDKLYVHDDGVGPFARMEILDETLNWIDSYGDHNDDSPTLSTSWAAPSQNGEVGSALAVGNQLVLPHYHKIRVQFEAVLGAVNSFSEQLDALRDDGMLTLGPFEWDIFLSDVADFRRGIRQAELQPDYRSAILVEPTPRFLWRAIAYVGCEPVLELVFDATDIEQGSFIRRCVEYDRILGGALRRLAGMYLSKLVESDSSRGVLEWFDAQHSTSP